MYMHSLKLFNSLMFKYWNSIRCHNNVKYLKQFQSLHLLIHISDSYTIN